MIPPVTSPSSPLSSAVLRLVYLLLWMIVASGTAFAAAPPLPSDKPAAKPARVAFDGREIVVLRATILDMEPTERAGGIERRIEEVVAAPGAGDLEIRDTREGKLLVVDGYRVMLLAADDKVEKPGESLEQAAERIGRELQTVVLGGRAKRAPRALTLAFLASLAATAVLYAVIRLLALGRRRIETKFTADVYLYVENIKIGGVSPFRSGTVAAFVRQLLGALFLLLACIALYVWLEFCLLSFPQTRPMGEKLSGYLWDVFSEFGEGLVNSLPGLLTIIIIAILARTTVLLLRMFFDSVARHKIELTWVDPYTAPITRRLLTVAVYVFAVAMAYPSIPGSDTAAFKGLTVLFGVMVSLGSTNVIGQALSGLILIYSRSLKPGEFVRVDDIQGTVTVIGLFATKIIVETGEELSIPNTVLVTTMTRNYSRTPEGVGGAIDTAVTLSYGTPWRQVHAMLVEAAKRTSGVRTTPTPYVRQTELHDFYIKYMLCARIEVPTDRVRVLDQLHQNILDVFNEYGVQIMSPHYMGDPAQVPVVPKEHWYPAPARPPADTGGPNRT